MDFPAISTNGLAGNREEAYRAGMMAMILVTFEVFKCLEKC